MVNIHYAKTHLSALIEQALKGNEVIIARNGNPVVRLEPLVNKPKRKVGFAKGQVIINEEFYRPITEEELLG